ncbi:protein mono-ADP-ribosyltransferase PARP4 isoform X1 [Psammomys obesus]|uniref:protein mono-ADP-ribosyltransferase PARP4 isoform X1 n=1 Tax=Psammomys obesus TaxID=48139 RepID=UPI0024534A75|nr:protein mono-ADP-ribosyltransferase PARP4 isoform X1 [Psammomys obesus]
MTLGIFENCIFYLKVKHLPRQQKKKLQTDIKENGGKFSFLLNPQCTHVIVDTAGALSRCQLNSIQKNDVQIANPEFIWDSVRQRRLLDVKSYDSRSLALTLPPEEKSCSEVETEDLSLDNNLENENTEVTEAYAEDAEMPHFLQDFEVVKYDILEKVGVDRGPETAVVELQCSRDPGGCPFVISAHFLLSDQKTRRESTGKQTSEGASEYYESYVEDLKRQGFLPQEHVTAEATQLASEKLQALLLEEVVSSGTLSQEVSSLVEMIWAEALGHLEHKLLKPVNSISLNDVSKAEGILLLVKTALKNGETVEQLQKTMAEFYRLIPHKHPESEEVSLRLLAQKEDLCQLVRDMVNVCETNLSKPNPPSLAKYRALRCKIEHIEQDTKEFSRVRKEVLQSAHSECPVDVLQIFTVGRVNEATEFLGKLGNTRPLFHGSPVRNMLGILSRGLLLPKVAEDRGVQRTDVGNLGSGIYFSDSLSTSIKYAQAGETEGSRLLVVCDVALGKCVDLVQKDFSLTEAPPGYDSVHGVSGTASDPTDFEDDEFVVYKTNQVKMKYIVKFCIHGDQIKDFHPHENTELEEHRAEPSDVSKIEDFQLPDIKSFSSIKAGLQDAAANAVPLDSVHIKGRIIDFVAQVIVFQTYVNQSHVPIEAKYIFPLDDKAAVCGFEAFINGKHIVGEIKEKEEAQQEYREAISQGHGAYLMDQDTPDVFTVSVGNLPPRAKVLIKITYITELSIQSPVAIFFMPATVAPWQQDKALNENLQDTVEKICVKEIGAKQSFSLDMSIEMPYMIEFISSDTHELRQKSTDCKAVVSTVEGSSLDSSGFSLHIGLRDAYLPRMWVEKHPEKESEACMLVFQPDLAATLPDLREKNEVIICLDCSNSMHGVTFMQAQQVALYALSLVGEEQKVNILQFGTGYKELFSYPKYIVSNKMATEFITSAAPAMGNTDFWKVLRYLGYLYPSEGLRNILLISDGHLQSESLTLQLVKRNIQHTRVFTCAVGSTANRHILRTLSRCGAGVFEYFNSKSKQNWKKQIEAQMARVRSPGCHSVSVKWQQLSRDAPEPLQAPARAPSLFHNDRLLVYGFIPHCTQATLCAVIQQKKFCTMVSTTELQKTTGTLIHKLAARALIRDYEDGILHDDETNHEMKKKIMKSLIIELSKENSLITQFTSFVAVEKRDNDEIPFANVPSISELIAKEDVDLLPYMSWQEKQPEAFTRQAKTETLRLKQDEVTNGNRLSQSSISFEGNGKQLLLRSTKECKRKAVKMHALAGPEDFGGMTSVPKARATAQSLSFDPPLSVHPQLKDAEQPLDLSQMVAMKRPGSRRLLKAPLHGNESPSMVFPASAVTAGFSFPSPRSYSSAFLPPLSSIPTSLPPLFGSTLLPPLPGGTHPPPPPPPFGGTHLPLSLPLLGGTPPPPPPPLLGSSLPPPGDTHPLPPPLPPGGTAHLSPPPVGFSPPKSNLLKLRQSCKLAVGTTFSTGFSSSKDFDPDKVSQDSNIIFSPKTPELDSLHKSPFRSPPKPPSVSPLLTGDHSSDPSSLQFQSAEVPPSPNYRISHLRRDSLESAYGLAAGDSTLSSDFILEEVLAASLDRSSFETETDDAEDVLCDESRESPVSWTSLFALQTEDGFWKLTPELGLILKLNVNVLHNFLEEKGIRSLGTKGKELLLDLIATLLVLQFLHTKLEQEGMVAKSLIKMDDAFISRNIPWAFENIKKASEWARRTEGQYPSICQRLELGKDWESATKQLLGIQPQANTSLHRILHYNQG